MLVNANNRRSVRGIAFKECEYCGRSRNDKSGEFNYQYMNEDTNRWDNHVFCSKLCCTAWHTINGD